MIIWLTAVCLLSHLGEALLLLGPLLHQILVEGEAQAHTGPLGRPLLQPAGNLHAIMGRERCVGFKYFQGNVARVVRGVQVLSNAIV